ncbi:MAG: DUF5666 domain-containing protein [Anaerolineales bacterium]|nr:DUF5666 domain-containing protein [Anaerolineales bacterium]
MKRLITILLTLVLLSVATVPAFAAPVTAQSGPRGTFALVGRIAAIDASTGTVTINVIRGSFLVKPYFGKTLMVKTTSLTRYLYKSSPTATPVPITFADLKVGNAVSVNGLVANNVWTASRITVGAKLTCFP